MKNIILFSVIGLFLLACSQEQTDQAEEVATEQTAAAIPQLEVATFDVDASKYVGSEIKVAGLVDHVCKHGGKKLKLVTDNATIHVESETRFDDELVGSEISLNGIVRELRVDESYCLQMEEDNIAKHKEGETNDEDYAHKNEQVKAYRDSMAVNGVDHLSFYTLEFISLEEKSGD